MIRNLSKLSSVVLSKTPVHTASIFSPGSIGSRRRSMLNCAVLDDYQKVAERMADWPSLKDQVKTKFISTYYPRSDQARLLEEIKDQEILVMMRERTLFDAELLSKLPKLKLLVTSGMRNAAIDLNYASKNGIVVCGTRSLPEPPIEHTWALILGLARHIAKESFSMRQSGPWQSTVGIGLHGKRLGILGLGKIGSQVAKIGKAFGMEVVAWSQNLTKDKTEALGISLAKSKEDLLGSSDFVSIHLVLSERTKDLISAKDFLTMKPTSYLINTSRAPIVNEEDLLVALKRGQIAGAGLDVFNIEPLPIDHPFRTLPNVLATPHIGYVTEENYGFYFREAVENIHAYLKQSPIRELTTGMHQVQPRP